jgi:hypothetical protein
MKIFVLVALLCVVPLISGKAVDDASSKCLVTYLKNKGFLGGKKNSTPLPEGCSAIVESLKASKVNEIRKNSLEMMTPRNTLIALSTISRKLSSLTEF